MNRYDLRLLGECTLERGGDPQPMQTRRTMALLARVAVTGTAQARSSLAAMFWPDRPHERALGNLRVVLSNIRRDVPGFVEIQRERVVLAADARCRVDVHRFDRAVDQGLEARAGATAVESLELAVAHYGGDLLDGFSLDVGEAFDEWLHVERTRLHLRAVQALTTLVDLHLDRDVGPPATMRTVRLAHRLVAMDPLREASQERLMRAQWRTGDRIGALEGFDAWAARLRDELGLDPPQSLQRLAARLRRDQLRRQHPPRADPAAPWPLVAREDELTAIAAALAEPAGSAPAPGVSTDVMGGVVLVGAAGLGKTRLVQESLQLARDLGHNTAWIAGTAALSTTPYGAVAAVCPEVRPDALHADGARHRAYAAALRRRIGSGQPSADLVLGVDDAHLLDDATAALILQLVISGRIRVVASLLPVPEPPDAITSLWKDGWARRLEVEPLGVDELGELLEAGLQGPVGYMTWRRVADASAGNLLHARELVLAAIEAGTLRRVDGTWRWDGTVVLTPRLSDLVARRLRGLDSRGRDALAALAIAAPLPLPLLEHVAGPELVGWLEARELAVLEGDGRHTQVLLGHPLYGDAVLDQLGGSGRQRVRRRLAAAAEESKDLSPHDQFRAVAWRIDAGLDADPRMLTEAAIRANEAFDHDLAARLATAAVDQGGGPWAALALATAAAARNRPRVGVDVLVAHREAVLGSGSSDLTAVWLRRLFGALHFMLGDTDAACRLLDDLERRNLDVRTAALVAAHRTVLLRDLGRAPEALDVGWALLDVDGHDDEVVFEVAGALMAVLFDLGRTGQARTVVRRVQQLTDASGMDQGAHSALWMGLQELVCQVYEGRIAEVLPALEQLYADVVAVGQGEHRGAVGTLLGICHLEQGRPDAARRVLRDAADGLAHTDTWGGRTRALCLLVEADARAGLLEAAQRTCEQAEQEAAGRHPRRFAVDLARARAWVAAVAGDEVRARRLLLDAADAEPGRPAQEIALRHLALRFGADPASVAGGMAEVGAGMDSPVVAAQMAHARALADGDAGALDALAAELEVDGRHQHAADVARDATRLRGRDVPAS